MRTKILLCTAAVVASLLGSAGVASAAPAQVLPTCEAQTRIVVALEAQLKTLTDSQDIKNIPAMEKNLKVLRSELVKLQADLDALLKIVGPTADQLKAIADLKIAVGTKTTQVTTADKLIIDLKAKLATAEANLKVGIELKDKVCAPPVVTTTATPPPVTTTVVPPPFKDIDCDDVTFAEAQRILKADPTDPNLIDTNGNGIACEAPVNVPGGTGSVETGGGPA